MREDGDRGTPRINCKGNRGFARIDADTANGGDDLRFIEKSVAGERSDAQGRLHHRAITRQVIGIFFDFYNELGGGFLESVYREGLAVGLVQAGLRFEQEASLTVRFRGHPVGVFRPDFVVANAVIVECKAVKALDEIHHSQLINYLRASSIEVGLLLNFGPTPSFKRFVLENNRKYRSARIRQQ